MGKKKRLSSDPRVAGILSSSEKSPCIRLLLSREQRGRLLRYDFLPHNACARRQVLQVEVRQSVRIAQTKARDFSGNPAFPPPFASWFFRRQNSRRPKKCAVTRELTQKFPRGRRGPLRRPRRGRALIFLPKNPSHLITASEVSPRMLARQFLALFQNSRAQR